MRKIFHIFFIIVIFQSITLARCPCQSLNKYDTAILNNVLNLTDNQIELQSQDCKLFKKSLTYNQRIKYNLIKKLEKFERKNFQKKKDYYKSNPQMIHFGNPLQCQ